MKPIVSKKYRMPLCPYLVIGNRKVLVHLDVFGVPQSLQWPEPGSADRLAWRDPLDEWPYWEEMSEAAIRSKMPSFVYADGKEEYLHEAAQIESGYVEDTNILEGLYLLPGGAKIKVVTFVPPEKDVWVRHYHAEGTGKLILRGEFFEKAIRGHTLTHMGDLHFRGGFDANPRGVYLIASTSPLKKNRETVEVSVDGNLEWTIFLCIGEDLKLANQLATDCVREGFESLRAETLVADRKWISRAKVPVNRHPFVTENYKRWLLSNSLEISPSGAMMCGPRPFWSFSWPRDCSFQSVALAAAGYPKEARAALGWHFANTPKSGVHEARYRSDGTPMSQDNRPRQGDNPGLLCWAAGTILQMEWNPEWAEKISAALYRMADHLVEARDPETLLPLPEADHRESQIAESIGVALPAACGLKQAAWISEKLGHKEQAETYLLRAKEIQSAMEKWLWDETGQYFKASIKPELEKTDISTCWGVYPLKVWEGCDPKIQCGISRLIADRWNQDAGGVLAAPGTEYESYWMYYASTLLLGVAGVADRMMEEEILSALSAQTSPHGLVPEQVGRASGNLWGCAPLPVTQSMLLLYTYMPQNTQ